MYSLAKNKKKQLIFKLFVQDFLLVFFFLMVRLYLIHFC